MNEKIPDPKELEKEIGDYLAKKFGGNVKISTPIIIPQEEIAGQTKTAVRSESSTIHFDMKPESLIAYLDQFMVKQDHAKTVLCTKICTHFNRIRYFQSSSEGDNCADLVGRIKNNILMIGPTGVGKTYMVKLIAKKIGVPFVKGDATKFSETGYVGGDVEDLVRDLVREADGDLTRAQYGIIYIDEIDKIASSKNMAGADVSRTGVQRALLKPLEETEVEMRVPHDPVSMIQEIEKFRKTGKREHSTINTKNILFIVSGAFSDLAGIIKQRLSENGMGFASKLVSKHNYEDILKYVRSEDLIEYGFESEFVGRLPIRALFENLSENDLYQILKSPNNPIILGKKLDFAAYGIAIKFSDQALRLFAERAFRDNTGARGLVSAVEETMILFEKELPSTTVKCLAIDAEMAASPLKALKDISSEKKREEWELAFIKLSDEEKDHITCYVTENKKSISERNRLPLTDERVDLIGTYYTEHICDIDQTVQKIKNFYEETKAFELYFLKEMGINLVFEEDAIDHVIKQFVKEKNSSDEYFKHLMNHFEHGLRLVREKTGKNRFFISKDALINPDRYISNLLI